MLVIISVICTTIGNAQTAVHSKDKQIKAAVKAAPAAERAEATVFGYSEKGELVKFREGDNSLVCLADDPNQSNFHVVCYHKDLELFMSRGRELKAKGYSRKKVDSLRRKEIEAGKLTLPRKPMALYSLTGAKDAYDYSSGMIKKVSPLYVIYVPYATEKSTGLSSKPQIKGAPWLMEPGMPWAHIMVMGTKEIGNGIRN
ncbi:hypothetical protein G3569_02815 [Aliifodinibius halophilus]|uniref:Uncharacterized protein n=1 Tax=Fodinibius halophilus TaxID=1736908 RepID=A0A6M1T817_9BACT|nr:hypothetical protein [Fodinibius halophilus]